jgi:hypothetical protein
MKRLARLSVIIFVFEILKSSLGFSQTSETITLRGTVKDESNRPIENTIICIMDPLMERDYEHGIRKIIYIPSYFCANTDEEGKFNIMNPYSIKSDKFFLGILPEYEYSMYSYGYVIPVDKYIALSTKDGIRVVVEPEIIEGKTIDFGVMILNGDKFYMDTSLAPEAETSLNLQMIITGAWVPDAGWCPSFIIFKGDGSWESQDYESTLTGSFTLSKQDDMYKLAIRVLTNNGKPGCGSYDYLAEDSLSSISSVMTSSSVVYVRFHEFESKMDWFLEAKEKEPVLTLAQVKREGINQLSHRQKQWQDTKPQRYQLTYTNNCFCQFLKTYKVIVANDEIQSAKVILKDRGASEESKVESIEEEELKTLYTIDKFFAEIQSALSRVVYGIEISYDEHFGYPTKISIDREKNVADEEAHYYIEVKALE